MIPYQIGESSAKQGLDMRSPFHDQVCLGHVAIADLEFDLNSRDDMVPLLLGLQALWCDDGARGRVLDLVSAAHGATVDCRTGRPGMDYWQILSFGVVKQGLACDFDRLTDLANNHRALRNIAGLSAVFDDQSWRMETILRNVSILDAEVLEQINVEIVTLGHGLSGHQPDTVLNGRADSFVVETDVEYPTDLRLLWDGLHSGIKRLARLCNQLGVPGWRQYKYLLDTIEKAFRRVNRMRKTNRDYAEAVQAYLAIAEQMIDKMEASLDQVREALKNGDSVLLSEIERFFEYAQRLASQVDRRLLKGETIPHAEKIFSVFEPHTRWISKGKAGVPVELGVPVCLLEDQHQFILGHRIMWEGGDLDVIRPFLDQQQQTWPTLRTLSLDRGFWSPEVHDDLCGKLDLAAVPKKGHPTAAQARRQEAPEFVAARKKHPGIESAINMLEHHGMSRILSFGADGFARMVGLAVVATNLIRVGRLRQAAKIKALRKRRRRAA